MHLFSKILSEKSYFGTEQQAVGTCTGHTANMLYATESRLLSRHLQTTKEIPHVVAISLSLSVTYISARTLKQAFKSVRQFPLSEILIHDKACLAQGHELIFQCRP
jgi:hypothetical protein